MTRSEKIRSALGRNPIQASPSDNYVTATELRRPLTCIHLGGATGDSHQCPSCRGSVQIKTFACAKHGTCTVAKPVGPVQCCSNCPDLTPRIKDQGSKIGLARSILAPRSFPPILRRNLLYYVYPVAGNGVWQTCIDEISSRLHIFNGKVVLCVAQDPKSGRKRPYGVVDGPREGFLTDSTSEVEKRLRTHARGNSCQLIVSEVENSPDRWEGIHHKSLFEQILSLNPAEATLYAHAKGVTRPSWHPAHRWRGVLTETLIDHWPAVESSLRSHACTGSFKKIGRGWPLRESKSAWHYSGSFFWFRNQHLFRGDWPRIDQFWAAIESYPSLHFRRTEAGCVFHEARVRNMNLYDPNYWAEVVEPQYALWKDQNAPLRYSVTVT